jgi:outer membrane protein OmpA-like peptidoglycan-associated protein
MKKNNKESFFWTSYSDLMTGMFFVMLILFVFTVVALNNTIKGCKTPVECKEALGKAQKEIEKLKAELEKAKKETQATQKELDKIREIEESVQNINSKYFEYDSRYKRHTLKNISVSFNRGSSNINDIPALERNRLEEVGRLIKSFVDSAVKKNPKVKYLLILEGQSSRDDYIRNYELSYERALALFKYWQEKGINCNTEHCEVIISGSGQESSFRVKPDDKSNEQNQRFVIHIIPKPGIIEPEMK